MKTLIRRLSKFTAVLGFLVVTGPFLLIASDWPGRGFAAADETLVFHRTDLGETTAEPQTWTAPDGSDLSFLEYPAQRQNAPLVVMIHGSGMHGGQLGHLAATLAAQDAADVLVPTLRGHGPAPKRRGDTDYIGQLEDDLAALIAAKVNPDQEVVLLGHSSGGGLAVRFAGGIHGGMADRAILLAPYLGHDAPTTRPNAGGWAHPLLRRYIGLEILNGFGVTALNGLQVVQLNVPEALQAKSQAGTLTDAYSYRLNTSYHPRPDFGADIASLPETLLIAGANDEAFVADLYQATMESFTTLGTYHVLPGLQHMELVDDPRTAKLIIDWLKGCRRICSRDETRKDIAKS